LSGLGLVAAGCSAHVEDVADASGGATRGLVVVERTASEAGTRTDVSAKFMRVTPSADLAVAERVVGSPLELPPAGRCTVLGGAAADDAAAAPIPPTTSIDLLDVGDLTVTTGASDGPMALAARAFPDLGALVSGVFYTSRDATTELPAPARYVVRGTGSAVIDRFTVEADAPPAPEDVRVGDAPLVEGVTLEDGAAVPVHWAPPPAGARGEDLVYVDVTSHGGAGVRCAFRDAGEGLVPAGFVSARVLGGGGRATMAIHRVHREVFAAPGIDAGEVRFDLAVSGRATLTRAPRP
jgi:hypothetical protein